MLNNTIKLSKFAAKDIATARKVWVALNKAMVRVGFSDQRKPTQALMSMGYEVVETITEMCVLVESKLTRAVPTGRKTYQHTGFGRMALQAECTHDTSAAEALLQGVLDSVQ